MGSITPARGGSGPGYFPGARHTAQRTFPSWCGLISTRLLCLQTSQSMHRRVYDKPWFIPDGLKLDYKALSLRSLDPLAPLDALFLQPQVLPGIREESTGSFQGVGEKAVGKQETLQGAGLPSSAPASERFPVPRMTVFRSLC